LLILILNFNSLFIVGILSSANTFSKIKHDLILMNNVFKLSALSLILLTSCFIERFEKDNTNGDCPSSILH